MTAIEGELPGWADGTLIIGETRGPRANRETALTTLPPRPSAPNGGVAPEYMGYYFDGDDQNARFVSGFGTPTFGMFSLDTKVYGQYKNFGMIAQDKEQATFSSATPDDDITGDCGGTKYVNINIVPHALAGAFINPGLRGAGVQ